MLCWHILNHLLKVKVLLVHLYSTGCLENYATSSDWTFGQAVLEKIFSWIIQLVTRIINAFVWLGQNKKLYKGPSIVAPNQILANLVNLFQRRIFFNVSANQRQESSMMAMFFCLIRISNYCFLQQFSVFQSC